MQEFNFHKIKYGKELLIDRLNISEIKELLINRKAFKISFYEIFFITKRKGIFVLDDIRIPDEKGTIIFLSPNRRRVWTAENETDAYVILFEGEFIEHFFNDNLFIYRFHYFHNNNSPFHLKTNPDEFSAYLEKTKEIKNEITNLMNDSDHLLRTILYYLLIIAYKLNFSEPANFNRFFKKITLITPHQFRIEFSK